MVFKELEIQGFKSFPDKVKIRFDEGVTGVVGPNGSGKSNLSDAVRWVLGAVYSFVTGSLTDPALTCSTACCRRRSVR